MYPLLPSISTFLSLHLSFSGLTSKTVQVINDQKSSSSSNISVFCVLALSYLPNSPLKSKSISLSRLQNMKSALVERCQSSKMWFSMWNTPPAYHPHVCVSFFMVIFSWLCQSRIQLWSDFVTSKSALTQWHMTQIVKSSSVTGARCDLCHLVSRKSNNIKRTFAKDQLLTDFLEA